MYDIYLNGSWLGQFPSFVKAVKVAQLITEYFEGHTEVLLKGKRDQLRISWSSNKSYIGNHGGSFGQGDCMKTHKRIAKKFGWWNA